MGDRIDIASSEISGELNYEYMDQRFSFKCGGGKRIKNADKKVDKDILAATAAAAVAVEDVFATTAAATIAVEKDALATTAAVTITVEKDALATTAATVTVEKDSLAATAALLSLLRRMSWW
eukprot:TRINITY_DN28014_c0_g1_i1.p1 TRINITY_DN28014_c0_g1~~TRINITY_DN28014_c0_g1_i1.p1  ORF type:complete len:130 (+),score=42.21 TRINITY_DN28014_c0_g1_i1:26-391(+)